MPMAASPSEQDGSFQLNLQPQKANVFVTQLSDQHDHEDDDIRRFPIVKETSDELLRTGINTLQKTSLLRKAVEVKLVDEELAQKREEFRKRMEVNKAKEEALKKKQEKIKERVRKFDKFLKENESKRNRALQKYQKEVKENKRRSQELLEIESDAERLKQTKDNVLKKLQHYKKFADFMVKVVDILPDGYIEMSEENMTRSFIHRYEALASTHSDLIQRNKDRSDKIERGQRKLEAMQQSREEQRLLINHELAELQKHQESLIERSRRLEQQSSDTTVSHRSSASELGRITMAIDNLAGTCRSRYWPDLAEMSYVEKLSRIFQHFKERERVVKLVEEYSEADPVSSSVNLSTKTSKDTEASRLPPLVTFADTKPPNTRVSRGSFLQSLHEYKPL